MVSFAVGCGGFGGPRTGKHIVPCINKPNRKPDLSIQETTCVDQAALYRLSGDLNPLHIDENMAAIRGYPKPILHGLCTLGFSARIVLTAFAESDSTLFKALKV